MSQLAEQLTGVCGVEILEMTRAFHLRPDDPDTLIEEFKQAVGVVEDERKRRRAAH